jgi:hypothetical protein
MSAAAKTKYTEVETFLPLFTGYYYSDWSDLIDNEEEMYLSYRIDECGDNIELDYLNMDYTPIKIQLNKIITEEVMDKIKELFPDLIKTYEYQSMHSPREYNFYTDSINIKIEINFDKLMDLLYEQQIEFCQYLRDKYTPRSGFVPSHSFLMEDWLDGEEHNLNDAHKCGACLEFLLLNSLEGFDDRELVDLVRDRACGNGEVDFEFKVKEKE